MTQYLLGELPPAWQEHFEEQFFTDQEQFEQLKRVEDQLVDDYVSEVLPASQRARFESHYLNSERRRQKLQFAQSLKKTLAEMPPVTAAKQTPSFWQSLGVAWRTPALRYSFAALVLLAVMGGSWLLWEAARLQQQRQQLEAELAALAQPTATAAPTTPELVPGTSPATEAPASSQPSAATKPERREVNVNAMLTLMLTPGTFRDDQARTRTLIVTPQNKTIQLQLALQGQERYSSYRVVLETASGQTVRTQNGLRAQNDWLLYQISAQSLPANDYLLTLSGKKKGDYEEVEYYQFRVVSRS